MLPLNSCMTSPKSTILRREPLIAWFLMGHLNHITYFHGSKTVQILCIGEPWKEQGSQEKGFMHTDWFFTPTTYFSRIPVCFGVTTTISVECLEERWFTHGKAVFWQNPLSRSIFSFDLPRACFLLGFKTGSLLSIIRKRNLKKVLEPNVCCSDYPKSSSGKIILT